MKMPNNRVRALLMAAVAVLVLAILMIPLFAQGDSPQTVTAFEPQMTTYSTAVPQGTAAEALALPASLRAVATLPEGADPATFAEGQPAGALPGTLPDGYTVADSS
ncbi:MAG: hypothetical protein FWC62_05330, partial [Firmicutes bacterium]|nr:hypothetical protein [Bacillota bacterium]